MPTLTSALVILLFAQDAGSASLPPSLMRALEARRVIISGRMEWTLQREDRLPGRIFRFENRYAFNGDRVFRASGDQDGWVDYDIPSQEPRHRFPMNYLIDAGGAWQHADTSVIADFWSTAPGATPASGGITMLDDMLDPRCVGLSPFSHACFDLSRYCDAGADRIAIEFHQSLNKPQWEERRAGDRVEVVARLYDGSEARWLINPERDWSVERCDLIRPDAPPAECTLALRQIDGMWFPEEVRYLRGGKLLTQFRLTSAELNRPDDPDRFGPNDIGLEPGFNIKEHTRRPSARERQIWDGERTMPASAWFAAVDHEEKTPGPTMQARQRGEHSKYMTPRQLEDWHKQHRQMHATALANEVQSAWRLYTLGVCDRFALEAEQRQKAIDILTDCQEQAGRVLSSIRDDLLRLQADLSAAYRDGNAERTAEAHQRLAAKTQPIEEIFQKQLVPRLDQLPTRQQREAATAPAATQPTSQPAPR